MQTALTVVEPMSKPTISAAESASEKDVLAMSRDPRTVTKKALY